MGTRGRGKRKGGKEREDETGKGQKAREGKREKIHERDEGEMKAE